MNRGVASSAGKACERGRVMLSTPPATKNVPSPTLIASLAMRVASRLDELVADALRDRITGGDLRDGDLLPKQEELLAEFRVSKPSLREALRILETEGLITVRRGNVGGAVVHLPDSDDAGYMIGLIL